MRASARSTWRSWVCAATATWPRSSSALARRMMARHWLCTLAALRRVRRSSFRRRRRSSTTLASYALRASSSAWRGRGSEGGQVARRRGRREDRRGSGPPARSVPLALTEGRALGRGRVRGRVASFASRRRRGVCRRMPREVLARAKGSASSRARASYPHRLRLRQDELLLLRQGRTLILSLLLLGRHGAPRDEGRAPPACVRVEVDAA